jgi:RNA polymerase sigma-B factor
MGAAAPTLLRDWDVLQRHLVPHLLDVERTRTAKVWAIGSAADAVSLTVAYQVAHQAPPTATKAGAASKADRAGSPARRRRPLDRIQVFTSEESAEPERVSFTLSEVRCIPISSRSSCFMRQDRRWVPGTDIAERVMLSEPSEPVDLVTLRANGSDGLPREAVDHAVDRLRQGGHLFLIAPPARRMVTPRGLRAVGAGGRVFRKSAPTSRSTDRHPLEPDEQPQTLAHRHWQGDLVNSHVGLARSLARRFVHHGEPADDLEQVALLALVKAARRFDAARDTAFATYATASILGELKRHFRDKTWMLRVPRSLQERYLALKQARDELSHELGCSPSTRQIAVRVGVSEEAILEAMEAGDSYWPASLDVGSSEDEPVIEVPVLDEGFDRSLDRQQLGKLLPRLDHREQVILRRLYFDGWTQRRVADEIGVSQMQVSRLLVRTIEKLRRGLEDG